LPAVSGVSAASCVMSRTARGSDAAASQAVLGQGWRSFGRVPSRPAAIPAYRLTGIRRSGATGPASYATQPDRRSARRETTVASTVDDLLEHRGRVLEAGVTATTVLYRPHAGRPHCCEIRCCRRRQRVHSRGADRDRGFVGIAGRRPGPAGSRRTGDILDGTVENAMQDRGKDSRRASQYGSLRIRCDHEAASVEAAQHSACHIVGVPRFDTR
jgi:hypothetical protein